MIDGSKKTHLSVELLILSPRVIEKRSNQIGSSDSPKMNIATRSAYAAILVHFFQPPTSETRILRHGFAKNSLTNVYMMLFLITQEV